MLDDVPDLAPSRHNLHFSSTFRHFGDTTSAMLVAAVLVTLLAVLIAPMFFSKRLDVAGKVRCELGLR